MEYLYVIFGGKLIGSDGLKYPLSVYVFSFPELWWLA